MVPDLNLLRATLPLLFISSSCSASTVTLIRHGLTLLSDCSFEGDKDPCRFFRGVDFSMRSSRRKECEVFVGLALGRGLLRGVWYLEGVNQLRRPGTGRTGAGEMRYWRSAGGARTSGEELSLRVDIATGAN